MSTLGKRVRKIIVYNGTTTTGFAKALNISQSMVSKICTEKSAPSERTIADICRIFHINKEWLLHGAGEMVASQELETELEKAFETDHGTIDNEYKRRVIKAMVGMPPVAWALLADYATHLTRECQENPDCVKSYADGYKEGICAGKKIAELIEARLDDPEEWR